jgi:hypothetical protein
MSDLASKRKCVCVIIYWFTLINRKNGHNFHILHIFLYSSQVLFSISQKLIQHQIINYTEILKWLQEILVCRNGFLMKHSSNANIGSNIPVCKQAHIKLEVNSFVSYQFLCFDISLWSIYHKMLDCLYYCLDVSWRFLYQT